VNIIVYNLWPTVEHREFEVDDVHGNDHGAISRGASALTAGEYGHRLFHRRGRLEPLAQMVPVIVWRVIWEIGRVRDACLLLAGERPYREFPLDWIQRRLGLAGFRLLEAHRYPIRYRARYVHSQLDMCLARLEYFPSKDVGTAMRDYVEELWARALELEEREAGLRHGHDYVIAAEPM
jgi:hypothetical protein